MDYRGVEVLPVVLSFSSVGANDPGFAADALRNSALRVVPMTLPIPGFDATLETAVLAEEALFTMLGAFGAVESGYAGRRETASGPQEVCFEA